MSNLKSAFSSGINFVTFVILVRYKTLIHVVTGSELIRNIILIFKLLWRLRTITNLPFVWWIHVSFFYGLITTETMLFHLTLSLLIDLHLHIFYLGIINFNFFRSWFVTAPFFTTYAMVNTVTSTDTTVPIITIYRWFTLLLRLILPNQVLHMLNFGFLILIIQIWVSTSRIRVDHELVTFSINLSYHLVLHVWRVLLSALSILVLVAVASLAARGDHLISRILATIYGIVVSIGFITILAWYFNSLATVVLRIFSWYDSVWIFW